MIYLFVFSCTESSPTNFEPFDFVEETPFIKPIDASLLQPTELAIHGEYLWLIDKESFMVHQYDAMGNSIASFEFSTAPEHMISNENVLFVSTEKEVFQYDSDSWYSVVNTDNPINALGIYEDLPAYVINYENNSEVYIDSQIFEIEITQDAIYQDGEHWYFINKNDKQLAEIIFDDTLQSAETSILHNFEDIPHKVTSYNDDFFVTTRSFRWPYAGWIVGLREDNGTLIEKRIGETPPEPEHILYYDNYVYWSSKQSLTRINQEGGSYEMVAPQTTIGDLIYFKDAIWWTDTKGGRLFRFDSF